MAGAGYGVSGRVLIVDSDPVICALLWEALGDAGLEVACAHDERTAQALIPTLPTFSALVIDVMGTSGFDVARFARQVIPEVLVIYMSGATPSACFEAHAVLGGQFIQKPFTPHELLERLA